MPATYDPALGDNVSWVRFLVGDVDMTRAMLQDEEIASLVASEPSNGASLGLSSAVYYAAAEALSILHTRWMTRGRGLSSKKVIKLAEVFGTGGGINIDAAVQLKITELRKRGSRLLATADRPYAFRVV